jgi:hypothetical protein
VIFSKRNAFLIGKRWACLRFQCHDVFDVIRNNISDVCNFVTNNDDCQMEEGFINYIVFLFCPFEWFYFAAKIVLLVRRFF